MAPAAAAAEEKAFPKRDVLVDLELAAQARWEAAKVFEADAPADGDAVAHPKYMATFPYPYMNGMLHMGHAFSLSKPEFAVGYERLKGKRALFPFGFHVTGMPIKACADKLKHEVAMFGPDFAGYKDDDQENALPDKEVLTADNANDDPLKIKKKHGKAAAKATGLTYQFQIMRSMGIPNEEIKNFVNPQHWLYYFPPFATQDLKRFGAHIDWRRSFITTDVNPYYDSFIRWQFNRLHAMIPSKVQFGERYTIYSPVDGQACMDHDRASGEGLGVKEYTGVKLQVRLDLLNATPVEARDRVKDGVPVGNELSTKWFEETLGGRKLYLVAATLRPETMYGQTNCYVGVDIDYGVFAVNDKEAWVCTDRAARNMAWQSLFAEKGQVHKLADLKGWDLVGVPLSAPLSNFEHIYTLPMEGVLATTGTGIVTSVPSDSPDDYVTLLDLAKKAAYYNVQKKWVEPFLPPRAIIRTPTFGDLSAVKDKKQLAEAKDLVYKEGFYQGVLIARPEAKPVIRQELIDRGDAFVYCEPEGLIMSRSGDECVVTLASQWYMDYGEESWKRITKKCLAEMNTYTEETRHAFEKTLDWLNQWACSRSFGLGSRLPWDRDWLIESLSDSTIYMAYYTVAHILHGGNLDGSKPGSGGILPEQMTDDVWSYILVNAPYPEDSKIDRATLEKMRREFNYFYPLDLRCSGKDLINNHLTFFLYNHTAVFGRDKWPKAIRTNGHLLLNGEKMSKSTGTFKTIREIIARYGADATRFALADAGDGLEDANFVEKTADDAILKLFTEKEWIEEVLDLGKKGQLRTGPFTWNDRVFAAEMDAITVQADKAYGGMLFREALKISFYDLQNARNEYRKATTGQGINLYGSTAETFEGMHADLINRFIEVQALTMAPITPHWSEHLWVDLLKKPESIMLALWPKAGAADVSLLSAAAYVREIGSKIRSAEDAAAKKSPSGSTWDEEKGAFAGKEKDLLTGKDKGQGPDRRQEKDLLTGKDKGPIAGQEKDLLTGKDKGPIAGQEKDLLAGLMKDKRVMPFIAAMKKSVEALGKQALDRKLDFAELDTLQANLDSLRRDLMNLRVSEIRLLQKEKLVVGVDGVDEEDIRKADAALPGAPTYRLL
ncbi:hypothetical protein BC831DRAFT_508563 [Entophlyctis helioformis]|nr:hypothetical protein BC831DRAFT_508563 [Entophlyctis helioformis]